MKKILFVLLLSISSVVLTACSNNEQRFVCSFQNNKDIISNKINLILNKLSESNIDNLIIEFIQNINQIDHDTFNEIQKTFRDYDDEQGLRNNF